VYEQFRKTAATRRPGAYQTIVWFRADLGARLPVVARAPVLQLLAAAIRV